MNKFSVGAVAILLATTSMPVFAQTETGAARVAGEQTDASNDIIVTATKKAGGETLQKAGVAVTALGAVQLEAANVKSISDIAGQAPNVSMLGDATTIPRTANFYIRGTGTFGTTPSNAPAVGFFIDGVYLGVNIGAVLDTFDVESVEVLRGPQGLLFGRNATGGAILMRTTSPSHELKIAGDVSVQSGLRGTGANYTGSIMVTGPLNEDGSLRAKFAYYHDQDEGYYRNLFDGSNIGKSNTDTFRLALAADIGPNVVNTIRYERGTTDGDGFVSQDDRSTPQLRKFDVNVNYRGYTNLKWNQLTNETNIDVALGDGQITNIAAYRDVDADNGGDFDSTPQTRFHLFTRTRQHQFSDELRYSGAFGPVSTTVGLFYYNDKVRYAERRLLAAATPDVLGVGWVKSEQYAAFGSFDVKLLDTLTLNLGARYSWQKRTAEIQRQQPTASGLCSYEDFSCSSYNFSDATTFKFFTPKIGFQWQPARDLNVYGFYTRANRDGGYNLRQTNAGAPGPFRQETVDAFEIGVKSQWFDRLLTVNLAAFHNDFDDLQRDIVTTEGGLVVNRTANTANTRIRGVEAEIVLEPLRKLRLSGNIGYLDFKYRDIFFDISRDRVIGPQDYALRLPNLAPLTYAVAIDYAFDVGATEIAAHVGFNHRDNTYLDDANFFRSGAVDRLDANLSAKLPQGITLSVFGKNLTDNKFLTNYVAVTNAGNSAFRTISRGRQFGIRVGYRY